MPADIRSFFGGKGTPPMPKPVKAAAKDDEKASSSKRRSNARKVIQDSDEEDEVVEVKKTVAKKPAPKKKEEVKGEETTSADYFASSKPKAKSTPKSTPKPSPAKAKPKSESSRSTPARAAKKDAKSPLPSRRKAPASYAEDDDDAAFLDDEEGADDIYAVDVKTNGKRKDDGYMEISSDDDLPIAPLVSKATKAAPAKGKPAKKVEKSVYDYEMKNVCDLKPEFDEDDDESFRGAPASKKRKSVSLDLDSEDEPQAKKKAAPRKPAAKKAKKEEVSESAELQAIFDSIPTVRAPTPPPKDPDAKFDWRKGGGGNAQAPAAVGSKEIPDGAENCLIGLTFVFTGLLQTITREAGQELVKRYGGKVTGQPSSKTSYVVLGDDAGPSKLAKIKAMNIKSIDEDGLFALIKALPANGGGGKSAEAALVKTKADEVKFRNEALMMEIEENKRAVAEEKEAKRVAEVRGTSAPSNVTKKPPMSAQLWTTKYAPSALNQICGNKGHVEKIQRWLSAWPKSHKYNFQLPGPDGMGTFRALIISGPPGIGKTTAAHLAAKLEGYDVIESNASDTRSKKMVEIGLSDVYNNKSLLGYYAGDGKNVDVQKKKILLIMDEVDGMSAGDRGGVGALAKVCKKTDVPMILICNERKIPKMKPFDFAAFDIMFSRPTIDMIRGRIMTICHREGLKIDRPALEAIIEGSNRDIRQIVNMLSQMKLDQTVSMNLDEGKAMAKSWEKHIVLKPWDICSKLLGSGLFAPSSKATLNEKIELYFNDHEFSYLMLQENYLSCKPMRANVPGISPKEQHLRVLELVDQAAESISDGDLVDRMIHGSQQQWSLMPTHGVFSTVRPASFISGSLSGRTSFTSWLGNNSKQGKLMRYIKEIQSHMRLKTSGDRHEIRQQYLPVLWEKLINRLQTEGKGCVPEVIELMDSYYLTRDDFDYMMELGLGYQAEEKVKIDSQAKSTFTRLYNQASHPMPFMKASTTADAASKKAPKVAPDLEEAIEEDDDDDIGAEPKEVTEEEALAADLKKDKFIQAPKKKKAPAKKKAKKGPAEDEDEDDEDVEPKPAKGKKAAPKAKAPTKAKARK